MKSKIYKALKYLLLLLVVIFLLVLFLPRNYDVPQIQARENTKFWKLSTGSEIAYTLISVKAAKKEFPIIYLHGGPGGAIYNRNIEILSPLSKDGYDIYFYDQIGSGFSDRLDNIEEYTVGRHKRDLEEIVNNISSEKVILIGQSWGALLAAEFVNEHPDKVEKLIFTGPGPILPIKHDLANKVAPDSLNLKEPLFSNRQGNIKAHNIRTKLMMKLAVTFGFKLASDDEADNFATCLNSELNKSTLCDTSIKIQTEGGAGFYSHIMTVKSFSNVPDSRSNLSECKLPVLVMKGQCDNQPWGYTEEYLELFSNSKLVVIPNAGHAISIEETELYLYTIRAFLNQ